MIVEFILSAINFFSYGYFEVTVKISSGKNKVWTEHSSWLLNLSDYCCINSACQNFNFIRNTYRESISVYLLWEGGYDTNIYQITCTLRGRGLSWDILFFIPPPPSPPPHEDGGFLKKEFSISSSIKLKIIGPFRYFFQRCWQIINPSDCIFKGRQQNKNEGWDYIFLLEVGMGSEKMERPSENHFLALLAEQKGISWVITPHKKQKIIGTP